MGGTGVDLVQRLVDGDGAEGQSSEAAYYSVFRTSGLGT